MLPSVQSLIALGAALLLAGGAFWLQLFSPIANPSRKRLAQGWSPLQIYFAAWAWTFLLLGFVMVIAPDTSLIWLFLAAAPSLILGFRCSPRTGVGILVWLGILTLVDLWLRGQLSETS